MPSHPSAADAIRDRAAHWAARLNDNDLSDAERDSAAGVAAGRSAPRDRVSRAQRVHRTGPGFPAGPPGAPGRLHSGRLSGARSPAALGAGRPPWPRAVWLRSWPRAGSCPDLHARAASALHHATGEIRTVTLRGRQRRLSEHAHRSCSGCGGERRAPRAFSAPARPCSTSSTTLRGPFRVVLDNSEIQVLGTRFNVYRKKDGEVTVTVLEGKVAVKELGQAATRPAWERELDANQRIVYRPLGLMQRRAERHRGPAP